MMMMMMIPIVLLICCGAVGASKAAESSGSSRQQHGVPLFTADDLLIPRKRLEEALTTTGLIALSLDGNEEVLQAKEALQGLCKCSTQSNWHEVEGTDAVLLADGQTVRRTLATATLGDAPLSLPNSLSQTCSLETAQALDGLRDRLAHASHLFVQALDELLLHKQQSTTTSSGSSRSLPALLQNKFGGTYHSIASIVQASQNLEHFHIYTKQNTTKTAKNAQATLQQDTIDISGIVNRAKISNNADETTYSNQQQLALQVHTDAGLFLAFIPAHSCSSANDSSSDHSFYLQDPVSNALRPVQFPPNSVAIMLGAGAESWLHTPFLPLKATRHAVHMEPGHSRAWYGMMHLVPESAIVDKTNQQNPKTFGEMRQAMILKSHTITSRTFGDDATSQSSLDVSIGCGFSDDISLEQSSAAAGSGPHPPQPKRRRLQHVENAGACNNVTNFYCWMSCLDIPQVDRAASYIKEDYSLYCLDPSVLASSGGKISQAQEPCIQNGVVGLAMNSNCMGMWQPTAPGVPAYPIQVESSSLESDNDMEPWCYGGTSMYMDGFQWVGSTCPIYLFPSLVLESPGALVAACFFTIFFGMALEWVIQRRRTTVRRQPSGYRRLLVSASFYGTQLTMGYALMLVVMIYSIPLFFSVVVGIVGGHVLFSSSDALLEKKSSRKHNDQSARTPMAFGSRPTNNINGEAAASRGTEGERSSCSSSEGETAQQVGEKQCFVKAKKLELLPSTSNYSEELVDVPEGSTPCCQHTLSV